MSISLRGITKRFGKKKVIENFSLNIEKGSRNAILAPSGSGKTTLFRIISGLEKRFDGERQTEGKISIMFQEDRLFEHSTVLENVTAVSDKDPAEAQKLLDDLGLADSVSLFPAALSGGMKRRVALARALFFEGDIILLDECFTGLDDDTKEKVAKVINQRTAEKTLLLITHDKYESELLNCKILSYDDGFLMENNGMQ